MKKLFSTNSVVMWVFYSETLSSFLCGVQYLDKDWQIKRRHSTVIITPLKPLLCFYHLFMNVKMSEVNNKLIVC